jgi:hypothetical protein
LGEVVEGKRDASPELHVGVVGQRQELRGNARVEEAGVGRKVNG